VPKENVPLFEIFGPVMIGPSSSHTAGVARIAFLSRKMFSPVPEQAPVRVLIRFYGSLAATWKGHGSGDAVIAGLLGIPPEDERLFRGRAILEDLQREGRGFEAHIIPEYESHPAWHPNTLCIELFGEPGQPESHLSIRASSIGGGSIRIDEIDGYTVNLSGELEAILVLHHDEIGVIAEVSHILAAGRINIASTSSLRKEKGDEALLVVETDSPIPVEITGKIQALSPVYRVIRVPSLGGA
jgi:L-serine dehydratase